MPEATPAPLDFDTARDKAKELVARMSVDEKIQQLHGSMATINIYDMPPIDEIQAMGPEAMEEFLEQVRIQRHVKGNEALGIPRFRVTNGPVGVGMGDGYPSPKATALPMTIGLAAGFDPDLAHEYGDIIGSETATLGQHVLEGPGVCLHRTPIAGRNFEYFSEDPYLSGVMGVEVTKAIQAHDVIAMGKHYVTNDQENERFRYNVEIDEHVLRELYLLPFEMLVKDGDIAAIMSAYNRLRGTYATENRYTLTDILRREWGFTGYVQSDFWSCRSCAASLGAGMDHEMPDAKWLNEDNVKAALQDTSLEIETIDRALVRRYTQMFRFHQFDRPYAPGQIDAAAHGERARRIGTDIAVLLKNEGDLLPLDPKGVGNLVVIGQAPYVAEACNGGGGSSKVDPLYTVAPLDGLTEALRAAGAADPTMVVVDADLANLDQAVEAARAADTVVIMAGIVATEGADLVEPRHLHGQEDMIARLLEAAPDAVVVLKDSTPVLMPWRDQARAILEVWNQGSEDGHVVADLLFGAATPAGKVPTTYAAELGDLMYVGHQERYPGVDLGEGYPTMTYSEGLQMGYRWFQAQGIAPAFPFGFGLSYTTFEVSDVALSATEIPTDGRMSVTARVTNTGARRGAEVVQVYLGIPVAGQPPMRLVGFAKAWLEPGESANIEVVLDAQATAKPFGTWDYATRAFRNVPGEYTVYVGTSSEDTPFAQTVALA